MTITLQPLQPTDVSDLHVVTNEYDVRRDLHLFINYIRERQVKRLYRTNEIGKADVKRLAKLQGDPALIQTIKETGGAVWLDFVDNMALRLGLVSYDVKGSYRGYSSSEPTFPDNYIKFQPQTYEQFLSLSPVDQERLLLGAWVESFDYSHNEFMSRGIWGVLDSFSNRGSALGVLPTLNFANIRRFLLQILQQVEPGQWVTTASLVSYLKENHPYFLIPKDPKIKRLIRSKSLRYGNFVEGTDYWNSDSSVPDDAPDGFERVEGRYIERFLEHIPLALNYVDVAYDQAAYDWLVSHPYFYSPRPAELSLEAPAQNVLKAFRVHPRLHQFLSNTIPAPKVTLQPNFEIYIESSFYPATLISQLRPLTEPVAEGTTTILRLERQCVAAYMAEHEDQDVLAQLRALSDRELPHNVVTELQEWAGEAEIFTLYENCGLVEAAGETPPIGKTAIETIKPGLHIVRNPKALANRWQKKGHIVLQVMHPNDSFEPLSDAAQTIFPTQAEVESVPEANAPQPITIKQQMLITMFFPDIAVLEAFRKVLLDARCPVEVDVEQKSLTLAKRYEHEITAAIRTLADTYTIAIEEFV